MIAHFIRRRDAQPGLEIRWLQRVPASRRRRRSCRKAVERDTCIAQKRGEPDEDVKRLLPNRRSIDDGAFAAACAPARPDPEQHFAAGDAALGGGDRAQALEGRDRAEVLAEEIREGIGLGERTLLPGVRPRSVDAGGWAEQLPKAAMRQGISQDFSIRGGCANLPETGVIQRSEERRV